MRFQIRHLVTFLYLFLFFFFLSTDKTQEEILPTEKINNSSINSLFYFLHDVKVSQVLLNKPSKLTPSFFN